MTQTLFDFGVLEQAPKDPGPPTTSFGSIGLTVTRRLYNPFCDTFGFKKHLQSPLEEILLSSAVVGYILLLGLADRKSKCEGCVCGCVFVC